MVVSVGQVGDNNTQSNNRFLPEESSSLLKRTMMVPTSAATRYGEFSRPTAACRRRGRKNLRSGDRVCKRMVERSKGALYNGGCGVALPTYDDTNNSLRFPREPIKYYTRANGDMVNDRTYGSVIMPTDDERNIWPSSSSSSSSSSWKPVITTSTCTTADGGNLWQQYQSVLSNTVLWPYMATSHPFLHTAVTYGPAFSGASNGAYFVPRFMFPEAAHLHSISAAPPPILVTDGESDKGDAVSYGYPYTPDTGGLDGCTGLPVAASVDEGMTFLRGLMTILLNMIEIGDTMENERIIKNGPVNHPEFTGSYIPYISVWSYLERLSKYFHCSSECFVLALIYLDRAVKATAATSTPLYVTSYNVHRLLLTSLVLAVKFNDDFYYSNKRYAEVGCLTSTVELNRLEAEMLKLIDFSLYVDPDEYVCYWKLIFSVSPMAAAPATKPLVVSSSDDTNAAVLALSSSSYYYSSSPSSTFSVSGQSPCKEDGDDTRLDRSLSSESTATTSWSSSVECDYYYDDELNYST